MSGFVSVEETFLGFPRFNFLVQVLGIRTIALCIHFSWWDWPLGNIWCWDHFSTGHGIELGSGLQSVNGECVLWWTFSIRFWDTRSGSIGRKIQEKVDCFFGQLVCSVRDWFKLRRDVLCERKPWVFCVGGRRKVVTGTKEGVGCNIESHGSWSRVFCIKGGDLELLSEVVVGSKKSSEGGADDMHFRKNESIWEVPG